MEFSSFLTSLATSFLLFVVLMLLFTWLSRKPGNHVVYYPNRILRGLEPYEGMRVTRNPLAWIREALASTEADVNRMSGVDSVVYFVFLNTVLGIFVLSGLFLLPVLLPVSYTARTPVMKYNDSTSHGTFNDLDKISMGHIQPGSPRLWAFVAATYWVSIVAYCLLWKAYNHVCDLRAAALMSPEGKAHQFAVVVRDIPRVPTGQTRKEQIDSYFRTIYPDTYYRSMVVTNNKKANKIYEELEGYRRKLARAEIEYESSKKTANPEGTRPATKTGFLGFYGKEVDAIEYYDDKIKALIPKLKDQQRVTIKDRQQSAAVIFFNNRATAAAASQSLHDKMVNTWTVLDAPEARDLIWTNLPMNFYGRRIRQHIVYFVVLLTIFFYMIPIGFISALTTLENLRKHLPFLKPVVDPPMIKTLLEAYLPQLALILFLALLPVLLLFLSKAEGLPTQCHVERAAAGKYFYFTVLNVFIGVTLGSTLFDTFKDIENHPDSTISILGNSLPGSATFFLTFVALRFFVGYGLELARVVPLVMYHIKNRYLCKTEAEVKEAWAPGDLGYATRIPSDMLIVTIVLCYSVIAPIIIPFGVVYFGLGWVLLRNQVLKVYYPSYESYGKMWPHIFTRIMASLILYQITMLGYFITKKFYYTPILIPLPIMSLIFIYTCTMKFYQFFQCTALEVVSHEVKETPNLEAMFLSFIPACLRAENSDEHHFEGALGHVCRASGTVSSSC